MTRAYDEAYRRSIEDPEGFWGELAEAIDWTKTLGQGARRLDNPPFYRWFTGAETQHLLQRRRPPCRGGHGAARRR